MKLLGSTKDLFDSDKNSENVSRLENVEVVLVHCNLVYNSYHQHSRVINWYIITFFNFFKNYEYGIFRTYKMRYSLEPRYRRYVHGQGFISFARNIGNKYGKKLFDKSLDVGKSMKKNMVKKY